MDDKEAFFYLQLLFDNSKARDERYGREHILFDNPAYYRTATETYEILHRHKGSHLTYDSTKAGRKETFPTIELVMRVHSYETLDLLLTVENFRVGIRKKVSSATLSFTTDRDQEYKPSDLRSFQSEFEFAQSRGFKYEVCSLTLS